MGESKGRVERKALVRKMRGGTGSLQKVIRPRLIFAASEIENISVGIIRPVLFRRALSPAVKG